MKSRGSAALVVLVAIAAVGAVTWLFKPGWLPGSTRRAANSTAATERVLAAADAQESAAAASVVKIGEANSMAPESPAKKFIGMEVPLTLSRMGTPDPIELIAAEKRRAAVMEGELKEAQRLYEQAQKKSANLQSERDAAIHARRAADIALEQAAAAEHARTVQFAGAVVVAILLGGGWIWAKLNGIHPSSLGKMLHAINAGASPETAFDTYTSPRIQSAIAKARKLAAP